MIAVIQRIKGAKLFADGDFYSQVDEGLYILLGVAEGDTEEDAELLATKIKKLRIFSDEEGKMNLSVLDTMGQIMVVSNFTLLANYAKGNRPDYLSAAHPSLAEPLYMHFVNHLKQDISSVFTGKFGADMRTELVTDGPVTIVMHSDVLRKKRK